MKPSLIFVHGWASNSTIWAPVINALPDHNCHTIDLGFISGGTTNWDTLQTPAIYIGHSLGVLWLLKNAPNAKAMISIAGFANFTNFTDPRTLKVMQRGLSKNPEAQISHFWRQAGYAEKTDPQALEPDRLSEGLTWLETWDATAEKSGLTCPKFILASKADKIVPPEATEEQWPGKRIHWHDTAPHMLPLNAPEWTATKINDFIANDR